MKRLMLLLPFLLFACANDDDTGSVDNLENTQLLGEWEIIARGIDNITSGEAFCCEFIEFLVDDNPNDYTGNYIFNFGTETQGIFTVNLENAVIDYTTSNGNTSSLEFTISESGILDLFYFEEGSRHWTTYSRTE